MRKYELFTDDELYILKRQAIESSYHIVMEDRYSESECKIHNDIMNEIIDEIKYRGRLKNEKKNTVLVVTT